MCTLMELRPNKDLLDGKFIGFKLSLDPVPIYRHNLHNEVDHVLPSDDQYSFLHVKVFGLHNHLFGDPWARDDVYFIDKQWRVHKSVRNGNTELLDGVQEVWEMPSNHVRKCGHYNTSLSFSSPELAVLSDGAGTLHVVHTGIRVETTAWKVLFSDEVCGKEKPFTIVDSRVNAISNKQEVHVLLLWVDEVRSLLDEKDGHIKFVTKLEWVTLLEGENRDWLMQCVRQLSGVGGLDYAALEPSCHSLYIASGKPFQFDSDSESAVEKKEPEGSRVRDKHIQYAWLQTTEDITVWLQVPEQTSKSDVNVTVDTNSVKIKCKEFVLLEGSTWHCLESQLTTWALNKGKLEITLVKREQGLMWQEFVKGETQGEEVMDPALVEEIHLRLAHLCSDKEVTDSSGNCVPAFNTQQLEECDDFPLETSLLVRLDAHTHDVSHRVSLGGHQWLFNVRVKADVVPAVCLRHDVDGCLWQFDSPQEGGLWPCTHIGTFPAFGYVQASKQQKKFCTCSPDMSYVAVCEASRHIYIYRQPVAIATELRNRHTGQHVAHVAKQQLVNLDSSSEVLGIHASCHILKQSGESRMG
ncbi:nudC domain-containing protein 1 isoform X2 [Zootermopsis nevadensis]|uniref:nudC domain-containing protein 1 isoform X2 n=1 Tax=Zootermopsis nevadensis TaxID=136037 RepID=UPI000B8E51E7|nr:nudC domain-containing protein 1 isoform X2 [Zootermopsis nevadensis]